jgi:CheY-like chemotaxis protein
MKKILIIDDEHDIREVLEMLIEVEFDVEIHHAANGVEGIEKIESDEIYNLIICDMNMPKLRGIDVYNHNKKSKKYPFILLSGDSENDVRTMDGFGECKNSQAINKPWSQNELMDLLGHFLAGSETA